MEKWKITAEIDSTMSGMDISQISELATAIMESWTANPANSGLDMQAQDPTKFTIKQEPFDYNVHQGYLHQPQHQLAEQVPMDDLLDPLESFSFWDGENFYSQHMSVDASMPPLPEEYDDEMSRDDDRHDVLRDLQNNPTLAQLNASEFDYSLTNTANNFFNDDSSSYQLDLLSKSFPVSQEPSSHNLELSKSFPAAGLDSHFVSSPVPSASAFGLNYVPSGYIDIKQNVQPSLSSSCPAPSRLQQPMQLGQQFLEARFPPLCPQNSPASDSSYFGALSGGGHQNHVTLGSPSHMAPSSPLRVAQSNRFHHQDSGGSLLSSSAPPDVTMATYFRSKVKTEPLLSSSPGGSGPRSVTERSLSGFSSLSLSNDDESGSFFDDDEEDDDFSSDEDVYQYESDDALSSSFPPGTSEKAPRKHRYFWQYNLQSRGARAQHILPRGASSSDPHAPSDPFDPVFHEECALPVKHSGKARRGDGNDLTPDPRKLHGIGVELRALNRAIYCVGTDGGKPLSRKEKNKLASRVCRLKKKAQHEANKIKLYGLQQEHKKLLNILIDTRELLKYKIENLHDTKVSNCSKKLETFLAANDPYKVAGNTTSFVNEVLEKVSKGEPDGGLGRL
ncbi:hypothetical protein JTE90_011439 [Oedothorax gibbosus]|uniref:BZIP domain-containing protein n=1 Tax=Oedothorax gibbosus TaxID=931172 RepID=A0AAV6VBB0_9ARAC|nr:hypothetical protein JTE90_011439 [Oedothorax gibbosus]